jgi:hypothetical protein
MTDLVIEGFTDREFSVPELTTIINKVPNKYGLVTNMKIFGNPIPLPVTHVTLERQNWALNLLPATERGAPGTKGSRGKRDKKIFEIPQITHEDSVKVADVQNLRAFGSAAPMMLEDMVAQKLVTMASKHFVTHEWYRIGALQGQILDSDGSIMLDLYDEFGITKPVATFGGATDIPARLRTVKRQIERSLMGEVMTGVACLASYEFMEMLFANADIKAAYNAAMAAYQNFIALNPTLSDRRFSFTVQEITFVEYDATFSSIAANGTTSVQRAIPQGAAIFFPLGTQNSAYTYVAPGDFAEAANMPGQIFYAKEKSDEWNRGRDILTQSNVLPLWVRPELLIQGTTGTDGNNVTDMAA